MSLRRVFFVCVFFLCLLLLDQGVKRLLLSLEQATGFSFFMRLGPFLNLIVVENRGISFSFLSAPFWGQQVFLGLLAVGFGGVAFLGALIQRSLGLSVLLTLFSAGAFGNALDRFFHGAVIDFIDVHFKHWHFPTFNLADSFLFCAVVGYLLVGRILSSPTQKS